MFAGEVRADAAQLAPGLAVARTCSRVGLGGRVASFVGYLGTSLDITERKLAEAALVSQKLIAAHEQEKTRIARELHDDISQRIALLGMHLGILKQSLRASATDLEQGIGEIHRQIGDLRPIFRCCRTACIPRSSSS